MHPFARRLARLAACLALCAPFLAPQGAPRLEDELLPIIGLDSAAELALRVKSLEAIRDGARGEARMRAELELAIVEHNLSFNHFLSGHRGYAPRAAARLAALRADGGLPEAMKPLVASYLGSSLTLVGNESSNPAEKISAVHRGLKILDEACEKYGKASWVPHFMRGNVCSTLPEFFEKERVARADYELLEKRLAQSPDAIPPGIAGYLYWGLGKLAKKRKEIDKAVAYWKRSVALAPGTKSGRRAAEMIQVFQED